MSKDVKKVPDKVYLKIMDYGNITTTMICFKNSISCSKYS